MKSDKAQDQLSQRLLIPQAVDLPPADAHRIRSQLEIFRSMGFDIEKLDADAFMVSALPAELGEISCRQLLLDVAKALEEAGPRRGRERWREDAIARAASQIATFRTAELPAEELTRLVADLAMCEMPYVCPKGRPTMILTSYRELARRFGLS